MLNLRYAVRVLLRQPGYTLTAILTLALGIGATTVIFSVLYGVLLKPLPWQASDRLVRLSETHRGGRNPFGLMFTNGSYLAWNEHPTTLDALAAWSSSTYTVSSPGNAQRIQVVEATASLFPLLGARPELGTLFSAGDEAEGAEKSIVLSDGLWRERFGGTPSAIGRSVRLDGKPYRVVAVMPASFAYPGPEARAWIPLHVEPVAVGTSTQRNVMVFNAVGRLRAAVTPAQAAAEGTARARIVDLGLAGMAMFGTKSPADIVAVPLLESETAEVRPAILIFFAAVALLLVTAIANVASLQLARAVNRRREVAIRAALGADARGLARQFLVESVVVALAGGAAGIALALAIHRALPSLLPAQFPRIHDIGVNLPVLAAAFAASIVSGIAFGLLPALHARRSNLVELLADGSRTPSGAGSGTRAARARAFIIVGQVAVACVLLVAALLLGRSFKALLAADRGYNPQNVLTATLPLPEASYTSQKRAEMLSQLLARARHLPGVTAAAASATLPLSGGEMLGAMTVPSPTGSGTVTVHAAVRQVSTGYFAAMGIRVLGGRTCSDADTPTSQRVRIVNRSFARQYLPSPAVGRQLGSSLIVGVVEDVHQFAATDPTQAEMYSCFSQMKDGIAYEEPHIVVRATGDPLRLVPMLRRLVAEQDRTVPLDDVTTMEDRVGKSLAKPRLYAVLLGGFAGFAFVIAIVGLFGAVSYSVAQRSHEIGVRTALGARPTGIVALVVGQGLRMALPGAALGALLSLVTLKYISTLLYGVTVYDGWTYAAVVAVLLVTSALACAIPARRAARLDPVSVLRQ